jgi:hypothetical protein
MANEGKLDRVLRVIGGVALLSLTVMGPHTLWGLVGAAPLVTGLLGFCPRHRVLGLRTCPVPSSSGSARA